MKETNEQLIKLAEKVRKACLKAAREGFQEASMSGLCRDGAIETALGAIQSIDLQVIMKEIEAQ